MKSTRIALLLVGCMPLLAVGSYAGGSPHASVIDLKQPTFREALADPANPFWFLKFYAPWCGHCKRLAPVLDAIAPDLKGSMAIGKIDCTLEKKLCDEFKVRGYPTLKFALDGEIYEYAGGRDGPAIMAFASKMTAPAVSLVSSYDEALAFAAEQTDEGVAFLGYDGEATGETVDELLQSTKLGQIFAQTARRKKASAYFLWLKPNGAGMEQLPGSPTESSKTVYRIEADMAAKPFKFDANGLTSDSLESFVKEQNVATVSLIGPSNFQKIGHNGKSVVVGVIDVTNDKQMSEMKTQLLEYITKTGPKDLVEKYYYGIIDGTKWARFLNQFNVDTAENPQIIIIDVPTKQFWQNASYPTVDTFMAAVASGEVTTETATRKKNPGILGTIEGVFLDYFPYSVIALVVVIFMIVFILIPPEPIDQDVHPDERLMKENEQDDQPSANGQQEETKKDK